MIIDGIEYQPVSSAEDKLRIVVCDRGFVLVGRVNVRDHYVTITNANCVRVWGTTRGLGQLAMEGPTSKTVLDPQPATRVHELQVVQMIDCEETTWTL